MMKNNTLRVLDMNPTSLTTAHEDVQGVKAVHMSHLTSGQ